MPERVVVLGAGVAGLTAAQELAERGFAVTVFENRPEPGGKARSLPVPSSGTDGRLPLPGEHGFRFFPGFYRHVPDTMTRIPSGGGRGTVADHLVPARRITISTRGGPDIVIPAHLPVSPDDLGLVVRTLAGSRTGLSPGDAAHFTSRLVALLTSCHERHLRDLERQSWWEFSGAEHRSEAYRKYLADGLTRTLVAAKATEMSARTGGLILLQLLADMARIGAKVDRVLDGPTSDVWILPWVRYLESLSVDLRFDTRAMAVHCTGGQISGVTVRSPASTKVDSHVEVVTADWYVVAVPVEIMRDALMNDDLRKADGRLEGLDYLETRWMNGVMYYLRTDVPLEHGHTIYIDSEWALTSISQQQFWPDVDLSRLGDGQVRGILSVDVSDWSAPAPNGKTAMACSREEVIAEVWRQLKEHLNDDDLPDLDDTNLVTAFVDPAIEWPNPTEATNLEPLLINTPGSWEWRPEAATGVPNLFLAGDYVRTYTDLATMEGANEAARRAVNAILEASGSPASRCEVWPLGDPLLLAPLRMADRFWLELRPHVFGGWRPPPLH